ncbi:MAG: Nif3-like dinuclear metal center hexameric protein [Legionellales bacterium RIFCSPHIGHO2_12_FULL_42_9]|nr:MAG: Nif3-like dinuclear metal center hexameric protein [Legionellales bacterium RIFCSPHIGHO2_12_FULL_42_9]
MILRSELVAYAHHYLACNEFSDYAPNGLQVEGVDSIQRLCTAVTASADVIKTAVDYRADALLVHHGFFWRAEEPCVVGMKKTRIALLLQHNINLLAYHLPLDCHGEIGNNVCLAKRLDIELLSRHSVGGNRDLLWFGKLAKPLTAIAWQTRLSQVLDRKPLLVEGGSHLISQVAWCSGGAQDLIESAAKLGADAYLSGEISERTFYQAKELGIHYFAGGHHATERFGAQALGEHLAERFNVTHRFIDSENPV